MGWFSLGSSDESIEIFSDIFPIPITEDSFVSIDLQNIYTRILTDTVERTQGIPDDKKTLLWDNCLASEKQDGLISLLSKAMVDKEVLFLIYIDVAKVVRKATPDEAAKIKESYSKKAEPVKLSNGTGIYVTFKNYLKSDMVKFYSALEYCAVGGLWKQGNLSKAIQIKINDLRASVSLGDSAEAKRQAKLMAEGLAEGRDILTDAKDMIESMIPDLTATNSMLDLIAKKQSFYLGMPSSYFSGIQSSSSLSDTGKSDGKAIERGLRSYYFSIIKPVLEGLFGIKKTSYKSEDSETLDIAIRTLETFDRTSDEHLSKENKTLIVNKAFGLEEDEVGDEPEEVEVIDLNDPKLLPPSKKPQEV